jgi:hypothetical protein
MYSPIVAMDTIASNATVLPRDCRERERERASIPLVVQETTEIKKFNM